MRRKAIGVAGVLWLIGSLAAPAFAGPPSVSQLSGTLHLTPGSCPNGRPTGSYLSVTFGTRAIKNPASDCDGGAFTLLSPGAGTLSTQGYSAAITKSVRFSNHELSLLTSSRDLQDAPTGAPVFAPPRLYLIGNQVNADLRSLQAAYGGGKWLLGAERATGTYDPRSRQLSLRWYTGQSFTEASAGTEVHLAGTFVGAPKPVPQGSTVSLGTASFDAGPAHPTDSAGNTTAGSSHRSTSAAARRSLRRRLARHHRRARLASDSESTSTGSPRTFLFAEVLVLGNLVAFLTLGRRRRRT